MFSYWEQASFLHYDAIVIGAGIVGLHTAIEYKERFPAKRVLVLERSLFPYGASTRNAGFACMGSFTELLDDLKHHSEVEMTALFCRRKEGLALLRQRLGDHAIDYRENGSHELISPGELPLLAQLDHINALIAAAAGFEPFRRADGKIVGFGFPASAVAALIENTGEGELHTGKMMRRLTDYALEMGIEIKTGAPVERFEEEDEGVSVLVADTTRAATIALHARHLFICTNAFTRTLLPEAALQPGRGQVLLTDPIPGLPFKGIFHFDEGYYYFREIDGRVLFGGGRNLDFEGETTTEIALNPAIQADLETKLRELILPGSKVAIAQRWAGIMAFGTAKRPLIQQFSPHVYGAFRMGGMGVALGAAAAKECVALLSP
ncbi:NAD(P)/FAD-dependent oxidoreductase [Taibaiella koreensis]|uniref:NAD(P)/FAD-dependent oxidoreductase n=1 Tax=Taibaiella koreensis TaxID=1268548 RepID=UPI000E59C6E4|nr:FAD-dependent oxidoreductase [Taibaiella koreensis]